MHALHSLLSLVLDREPALLPDVAAPLFSLAADPVYEIRATIAAALREIVDRSIGWLPRCLATAVALLRVSGPVFREDALLTLLQDTSTAVLKQTLRAAVPLYRAAIVRASQQVFRTSRHRLSA